MAEPRPRLYLIDGYSNIFRAFYAIRGLSNSRGEPTNAVYGFLQMLRKLLREEDPELVGVALDVGEKTVRSERFEEYKANRPPMPQDLVPQIPWIRQTLEAYRIPILEQERYEADDVLASLARKAAAEGYEVVLVSPDKDLLQVVGPGVYVYHTGRNRLYDPKAVEEDFGVPPEKVADVLALMGDSVDNVPGVPGIGEKGAKKLIQEFGSLEELLGRADEVERKTYRENLKQYADQARLSKELVTIHTDLPVPFDPAVLHRDPPDPEALRRIFTELEFYSLLDELDATATAEKTAEEARELTSSGEWEKAVTTLGPEIAVAAVGEGSPRGLAVSGEEGEILFADFHRQGLREAVETTLSAWCADSGKELTGHDLKEVLRLTPEGRLARLRLFDLMLVSYLLKPSVHGHSLEELALERLGEKPLSPKEVGWTKGEEPPAGDPRLLAYAAERIHLCRRLAPKMRQELGDGPLARIYREIEMPLVPVLLGMEEKGVRLDVEYLRRMSRELGEELGELQGAIYEIAGEGFNLNSPQQVGVVLFEKLGYPVLKRTRKTRSYATGAEVLEQLALQGYPVAEKLLRYRELAKLKSTYVDVLPELVGEDGRLHTRFYQAVAATGRLSSANPNLQNIPIRTELGQRIRRAFVAGEGCVLLVADYSQIELRILAHISEDRALLAAFQAGEDIHRATAATVFQVPAGEVTPEQRRMAKVINFGIIYGMSPFGLAQTLGIGTKEAELFITAYLERYPGVKRYVEETLKQAEKEGKVETLFGRVRWLPDIGSQNRNLRENARRMAINARIQGTAADLMKQAMVAIDHRLRVPHPGARLILTIHDELMLEVPQEEVQAVADLVRREMEGVATLRAPLVVDLGWGKSWYEAKP